MRQNNTKIYLISILIALSIVEFFFFLQVTFVLKEFKLQYAVVPTLLGITIGFLIGKVFSLKSKLQYQKKLFHTIADEAREFSYFKRLDGSYEYVSPAVEELTGYKQEEFYKNAELFDELIVVDDKALWSGHLDVVSMKDDAHENIEFRILHKDGHEAWINHNCSAVFDANVKVGVRAVNTNITTRKKNEEAIRSLSLYDSLTGLPNRKYIFEVLNKLTEKETPFSVIFLDLNRFKKINDNLGHNIGDNVLKQVAKNFNACKMENTFVGRLGGDEFLVVFENKTTKEELMQYINKLHSLIAKEYEVYEVYDYSFYIGASMGVATYPHDSLDIHELLACADKAMYKAKNVSSSDVVFYNELSVNNEFDDFIMEKELRTALQNKELECYLQAKHDTSASEVAGYEALVRWKKDGRFISPEYFIAIAEETGLIKDITAYMIEEVFTLLHEWRVKDKQVLKVSINLCMIDLMSSNIVETVKEKLQYFQVEASNIEFELTESIFLEDSVKIKQNIQSLIDLGCSIALDDFGTGYSSLSHLAKLPIHTLKIDKMFIDNLHELHDRNFLLLKSIIVIAKDLGLKVVVEGVETKEQLDSINTLGSFVIQGYYFHKPMSIKEV